MEDVGLGGGVGRERRDDAATVGCKQAGPYAEAVLEDGLVNVQRGGRMELDVGRIEVFELDRMKPPASAMLEVSGPRPSLTKAARFSSVSESNSETGSS